MKAEILVVRYGQPELEERCIQSVQSHTNLQHHKLTVVDNFQRDKNLGALWNELIAKSTADYICLLNSDTTVEPEWLDKLIAAAEAAGAGAVGPVTDHCGTPRQKQPRTTGYEETAQLSGFCLVLRKSAWKDAKGFREDAPFYGQESELLTRIPKKIIARDVFVHHEAGASVKPTGRAEEERALGAEWWRRNTSFDWKKRLAVIGAPESPFPLWQGINHAMKEFAREGMTAKHFGYSDATVPSLKAFRPDVILCVASRASVIAKVRDTLKQFKVPRGAWFNDLRGPEEGTAMAGGFDAAFLCFQSAEGHEWKQWEANAKAKVFYMPQGSILNTELAPLNIKREVLFIGGTANSKFHGNRAEVMNALNVHVVNEVQRDGRIKVEAQSRELYRQSRFALVMSPLIPGYNSLRLYNVMAYGGLPLVQRFPGLDRLFQEDRHFIGWSETEEAKQKIAEWSKNPEECEKIRKRAWRLQQAKHSVTARLMNMVSNLTTADKSFWGLRA